MIDDAGTVVFRATNRGPDAHELIVTRVRNRKLLLRSDGLTVSEEIDYRGPLTNIGDNRAELAEGVAFLRRFVV